LKPEANIAATRRKPETRPPAALCEALRAGSSFETRSRFDHFPLFGDSNIVSDFDIRISNFPTHMGPRSHWPVAPELESLAAKHCMDLAFSPGALRLSE